ncbi:MAG TPA: glutaredoxin domain-containing protein [Patescibacteria group bacterium]|nr:glutaredoxin domain-containing protein [Patescibacteria group bacterium]
MSKKIIVYGAEWCAYCHEAMRYFDKLGVEYIYKNVELDPADAKASMDKSGQTGIPVIDLDGTIVIGFNRATIDQVLKDKKITT